MSTQQSTRLFFLFALLLSVGQLVLAQSLETDYSYATNYTVNATSSQKVIDTNSPSKSRSSKPALDFSKGMVLPSFVNLEDYVSYNLVYPAVAKSNAIEGSVVLSLKLSPTGEVVSAAVVESLGYGCDEAALTLATNMPHWTPASNYGRPVGAKQLVEIEFTLK